MLDPEEIAKFDQSVATLGEIAPRYLKGFYDGFLEQGFNEEDSKEMALELTIALMTNGGGRE